MAKRGPGRPPKKRGPGRPPKKRGPGRPKGSKNKPGGLVPVGVLSELGDRLDVVQQALAAVPRMREVRELAEHIRDINARLQTLGDEFGSLIADTEHPTTQILARRLLSLETGERVTRGAHERLTQLETELRTLRQEFGDLVAERHAERNRIEVQRIAEQGDGGSHGR